MVLLFFCIFCCWYHFMKLVRLFLRSSVLYICVFYLCINFPFHDRRFFHAFDFCMYVCVFVWVYFGLSYHFVHGVCVFFRFVCVPHSWTKQMHGNLFSLQVTCCMCECECECDNTHQICRRVKKYAKLIHKRFDHLLQFVWKFLFFSLKLITFNFHVACCTGSQKQRKTMSMPNERKRNIR